MKGFNSKILKRFCYVIVSAMIFSSYVRFSVQNTMHRVFGVTYMTMNNPFYEIMNNELTKVVEANGDELIALDPALDVDKQIEQIEYLISQHVEGIFVNPVDSTAVLPVLKTARENGIPVVVVDSPIGDDTLCNSTIVSDNYDAGVQCAQDMMERMQSADIVLLRHSAVSSADERIRGFCDTIAPYPQYRIVNEAECEGQLEIAMPFMQEILAETENIDVVMALNDPSALGAMAALESYGKTDVLVYGVDGTPDMKALIGKSSMAAGTAAQSPIQIGRIAGEHMYALLKNETVEKTTVIPVSLITADNISDYDEKGWQ